MLGRFGMLEKHLPLTLSSLSSSLSILRRLLPPPLCLFVCPSLSLSLSLYLSLYLSHTLTHTLSLAHGQAIYGNVPTLNTPCQCIGGMSSYRIAVPV